MFLSFSISKFYNQICSFKFIHCQMCYALIPLFIVVHKNGTWEYHICQVSSLWWIINGFFFFLIDLMLCSNIKLLRINTIILFNIFQHVTKKQNLNQNWYCKLWCHWQKSKHWNGWKGSRFSLSWTISNLNLYYSIKTNHNDWFCRKGF